MKRLLTLSALTLTVALAGSAAIAGSGHGPDPEAMLERLSEHLELDRSTAKEMSQVMLEAHEEGEAVRATVKAEAQALKTALDAGDEQGMQDAMAGLEAAKREAIALKEETAATVKSLLTIEQQAKMTLHHLHKRHIEEQALRERRRGL
jgi:hypothetical protein